MSVTCVKAMLVLTVGLAAGGCAHDATRDVIREALATENPGRPDEVTGPPPVRPEALAIVPTGLPPTDTPAVAPQAILPRMDEAFMKRRLPAGVQPGPVATQPSDRLPTTRPQPQEKFEQRVH